MNVTRRLGGVALLLCACAFDSPDDTSSEDSAATWPIDDDSGLRVAALPPLPELEPWPDNPRTAEKRELGRALFYDVRLSGAGSVACSTCHSPLAEFQSNLPRDLPSRTIPELRPNLPRHTPSLFNIVFAPVLHWDGSESGKECTTWSGWWTGPLIACPGQTDRSLCGAISWVSVG